MKQTEKERRDGDEILELNIKVTQKINKKTEQKAGSSEFSVFD